MTYFNLRLEIRAVLDSTDLANPRDIAARVAELVPDDQLRDALRQALPDMVRVELGRARGTSTSSPGQNPSQKVEAIRNSWQRHLRDRIHIGDGKWVLLADCTVENLRAAAEERRANAVRSLAAAERYSRYADACHWHGVSRFGDLDPAVQATLLADEE